MERAVLFVGGVALCIGLERIARIRFRDSRFFRRYFPTDIVYLLTAVGFGAWMSVIYLEPLTEWVESRVSIPRVATIDLPLWMAVPLGVAAFDLGNYLVHYSLHRFEYLWAFHKVHHSTLLVDWLAAFRSHVGEQVLRQTLAPAVLLVAGFPLDVAVVSMATFGAFAVFNHSNLAIDLRVAESVFITPRLHRMHHNPNWTARRNYGTVFIFWDRLFGTLERGEIDSSASGVPGERESYPQTWLLQLLRPFGEMAPRKVEPPRES
jgi:sterol desaturase/sphingolipid hydroxylase (fatty acid hydroxylase superfamily)